jgi:hypothetical protein
VAWEARTRELLKYVGQLEASPQRPPSTSRIPDFRASAAVTARGPKQNAVPVGLHRLRERDRSAAGIARSP